MYVSTCNEDICSLFIHFQIAIKAYIFSMFKDWNSYKFSPLNSSALQSSLSIFAIELVVFETALPWQLDLACLQ